MPKFFRATHLYLFVSFLALIYFFWWFQVRPRDIRSQCTKDTIAKMREINNPTINQYDKWFEICLNKHGF